MSRLALILTAYASFSVLWGTRLLGEVVGDGPVLVVILGAVHLGLGTGVGRLSAVVLPLLPVAVAAVTGSDLATDGAGGYLVLIYIGAAAVVLAGVIGGWLMRRLFRRRRGTTQAA